MQHLCRPSSHLGKIKTFFGDQVLIYIINNKLLYNYLEKKEYNQGRSQKWHRWVWGCGRTADNHLTVILLEFG